LIRRYQLCNEKPEHSSLRDLVIQVIGHPWLHRSAWDAHVGNEDARKMVESWLKRRLMTDFFELLAHDGAANPRRLAYWLKYEERGQIDDMWFCLGKDARAMTSTEFKDIRRRMQGRELALEDTTGANNAFVMKIGELLVVEFGVTNNACFAYRHDDFSQVLSKRRVSTSGDLKRQRSALKKLSHVGPWERTFDFELRRLLSVTPARNSYAQLAPPPAGAANVEARDEPVQSSTLQEVVRLCRSNDVDFRDNRASGGAFWVLADASLTPILCQQLLKFGFSHKPGKGYWLKD
jgi:hypothetical protein